MKKSLYWVKDNDENFNNCPICNSKLISCHVGTYCSKCDYCDGSIWLTKKQAEKLKSKLIIR